jgi:hypothetical protein
MAVSWSNITYSILGENEPAVRVASNMDTVGIIRNGVLAALLRSKSGEFVYIEYRPRGGMKIEVGEVVNDTVSD